MRGGDEVQTPRRPWPRRALLAAVGAAVVLAAYPWAFAWSKRTGPIRVLHDNVDPGWAEIRGFERNSIVLQDGRRVVYQPAAAPRFIEPNVGLRIRESLPDGTMGPWHERTSQWGYRVQLPDDGHSTGTVTVWGYGSFPAMVTTTWNPIKRHSVPLWSKLHTGEARVEPAR